jgi:putative hydrolase of HD superfamily
MAFLLAEEFPDLDMNRVIRMCLVHDLGECFTGDIPVFRKTDEDRRIEKEKLDEWISVIPGNTGTEMEDLLKEMEEQKTAEARLAKALDKLEAVIQHNESPISTWEDHEYELNRTYAYDVTAFSGWLRELRDVIREETEEKIRQGV